jgi:hypothetical protein
MKIYLAGERAATATAISRLSGGDTAAGVWTKYVKRRLFSFFYHGFSGSNFEKLPNGLSAAIGDSIDFGWDLFLDSGAFTAFTKGNEIPIEEYARYIRRCLPRQIFTVYSALDAIGSGEESASATYANYQTLLKLGAPVKPVFHVREPDEWLQKYIDDGEDYIFIGGMVPETTKWLMQRLDWLWMKYLTNQNGSPKVRTHGFGLTDMQLMFRYPWHSVDSSSWLMTGIFGACLFRVNNKLRKVVFSEESPQARSFNGWHYRTLPLESRCVVDQWLGEFGVTAEQLATHYTFRDVVNAATYQGLEDLGVDRFTEVQPLLVA